MTRTPAQWLALPKVKLDVALARVFTPKPWFHKWRYNRCRKCGCTPSSAKRHKPCDLPDPIDSEDWNVVMQWRDKTQDAAFQIAMLQVHEEIQSQKEGCTDAYARWATNLTRPRDLLIAAATVAEMDGR